MNKDFDVIIIGAGINGLTAANLLKKNTSLKIALIDKHFPDLTWGAHEYDTRCCALNHRSKNILHYLQAWNELPRKCSYDRITVWDAQSGMLEFKAQDLGVQQLGHVVENRILIKHLWEKLIKDTPDVFLGTVNAIENIAHDTKERISLSLTTEANIIELKARLIIIAAGANSSLRDLLQIATEKTSYNQTAIVATITTDKPHHHHMAQCFTQHGPLVYLPIDDPNICNIVWSMPDDVSEEIINLTPDDLANKIANAFEYKFGQISLLGVAKHYPLQRLHAKNYVKPRLALIGDSAHVIHPLAGLGANQGLLDAAMLSEIITDAAANHQDPGNLMVLRKYERVRQTNNAAIVKTCDLLLKLFTSKNPIITNIRCLGLKICNKSKFIKKLLADYAMFNNTNLPKVAK